MKRVFRLFIFIVSISIVLTSSAQARQSLVLSPPTIEQTLSPGEAAQGNLRILNNSTIPLTFTVGLHDFLVEDTKGTPNFFPTNSLTNNYSAAAWISVDPATFTLFPQQAQNVSYYIQIPLEARPGGHYAGVLFTPARIATQSVAGGPTPLDIQSGTGTSVQTTIGSLVYITIPGAMKEHANASIRSNNYFQEYGPAQLTVAIRNQSDIHISPQGKLVVTDLLGRIITDQTITKNNIFPGADREYTHKVGEKLMIGRFKAEFRGTYGTKNHLPLVATIYFWVFPWKIALVLLLGLVALVLTLLVIRRDRRLRPGKDELPIIRKY